MNRHVIYHVTLCSDDMSSGGKKRAFETFEKSVLEAEAVQKRPGKHCTWLCSAPAVDICTALTPLTYKELKQPVHHAPIAVTDTSSQSNLP